MSKRDDVVIEAINALKSGEFNATGLKVELEANIDRRCDVSEFHEDFLADLVPLGLAKEVENEYGDKRYEIKKPLMYAKTYNDGSVDTEVTFTLSLADPKVVLKLPQILKVFKEVCEENGGYFETENAGMHLALLNDKKCFYEPANFKRLKPYDGVRFRNFSQSMIRLLPALYFLGSHSSSSRQIDFRRPQIRQCDVSTHGRFDPSSQKYSAIAFRHGAIEFRIFETCYDKPEVILDNLVVMANCMQFWTRAYTRNNLQKMPNKVKFGTDRGYGLSRLYTMEQHIDLLNAGLKILKPRYYTIADLKKQREFSVTKASLRQARRDIRLQAAKQYEQYEKKHKWQVIYEEQDAIRGYLERYAYGGGNLDDSLDDVMAKAKREARVRVKHAKQNKAKKTKFVKDKVEEQLPPPGNYVLDEEERPEPQPRPRAQEQSPGGYRIEWSTFPEGIQL